jgi:hypothetical protein
VQCTYLLIALTEKAIASSIKISLKNGLALDRPST